MIDKLKKGMYHVIAFYYLLFVMMLHIHRNIAVSYSGYLWVVLFYLILLICFISFQLCVFLIFL